MWLVILIVFVVGGAILGAIADDGKGGGCLAGGLMGLIEGGGCLLQLFILFALVALAIAIFG